MPDTTDTNENNTPTTPAVNEETGLPAAILEDGNILTTFVPGHGSIKDMTKPTEAELNAEGNLNVSAYLTSTGWKLNHTQESIKDDREASADVGEIPGAEKYDGGSLQVINNVNNEGYANAAIETLVKGTKGYLVRRRGAGQAAYKAGQKVSVFKTVIGIATPVAHADNARMMSTISFSVAPGSQDETATVTATA